MRNKVICHQTGLQDIISQEAGHTWVIGEAIKISCVMGQGILERSHSHTLCLSTCQVYQEVSQQSHPQATHRGRGAYLTEVSRMNLQHKVPIPGIHRWKGGRWPPAWQPQWQVLSNGVEVQQSSEHVPWYGQA